MTPVSKPEVVEFEDDEGLLITAKSGLTVNTSDHVWVILPNNGKGWRFSVGWVYSSEISNVDRKLILDVFAYYVRTKAASTASGIVCNVKPFMVRGIPSLARVKAIWSGLKTNHKKGLNQFFGTLSKQHIKQYDEYHKFTSTHLDKSTVNALDPSSGAFNNIEFDSLARQINESIQGFNWAADRELSFFQSPKVYGRLRNLVTNKLLLAIVRRPVQIALLKWSDLIPAGASFHDAGIRAVDEIGTVGGQTLQLRVFVAKSSGSIFSREYPERYPIHLSENLSRMLIDYKRIVMDGVKQLLEVSDIELDQPELLRLMNDLPMFPDASLFAARFESLDLFQSVFTSRSTAYHISEGAITQAIRWVSVISDRSADCIASSNRIRHTVLTRGAQDGLPAVQLARITGVTVPAARHYIDMDYKSRREIDSKYIGNEFLKKVFSSVLVVVPEGDEAIVDSEFNPVGGLRNKSSCDSCSTLLGRPLGCYGCPNFRPILEADHRSVLLNAENKLAINRSSLVSPIYTRSIEKLERQIAWVKLTIEVCDDNRSRQGAIDA
ncbi:hypothetical protein [Stutzerimonas nitrititolerans]|uniref:hypothetical protein n=1 Tax=Stutzerimonas nitrititolerans TaxID=2482751 RepID=UPI0035E45C6F